MLHINLDANFNNINQNFISLIYKKIYKENMSEDIKHFVTNIEYVGTGIVISTFFSFMFNILSGRILGPSEYGKFVLIQSIAMFLQISMLLGIPIAMVKYTSEKKDIDRQKNIISTSYILVIIYTIASTIICFLYLEPITKRISIDEETFKLAIVFAHFYIFDLMTSNTLRSLNEIKKYSKIRSICGFFQLLPLILFIYFKYISYKSIVYSIIISYAMLGLLTLPTIKKYIAFKLELSWAKTLIYFSLLTAISDVSYIIYTNIDKILINKYMLVESVGIYNAYFYSSINVTNIFAIIVAIVFLPTISKYDDKNPIFKKLNKFIPYLIVLGIPFTLITEYIILKIYGDSYPFDITLAILFGITAVISVWYYLYGSILTSIGIKGAKINFIGAITIAIVIIILDIYLIPLLGLNGAIIATISGYCCGISVIYILNHKTIQNLSNRRTG